MTKRIDELTGKKKLSKIIGMYHQKVVDSWTNHDGDYPKNVAKYGRSLALHKVRSSDDQESARKAVKFYNPHILQKEGTEMHDQIKAMLQSLEDGNAANAKDLFASVMSVKVADKIDALAPIVSLSMFEGKEGADDDEEEDEGDEISEDVEIEISTDKKDKKDKDSDDDADDKDDDDKADDKSPFAKKDKPKIKTDTMPDSTGDVKEEKIDELSAPALGSYVKKASWSLAGIANKEGPGHKAGNRLKGIAAAADKLGKPGTLGSYVKKSSWSLAGIANKEGPGHKAGNRLKGIAAAADKLAGKSKSKTKVSQPGKDSRPDWYSDDASDATEYRPKSKEVSRPGKGSRPDWYSDDASDATEYRPKGVREEKLDELSAKTIGSYVKRGSADAVEKGVSAWDKEHGTPQSRVHDLNKMASRMRNVRKATDKLTQKADVKDRYYKHRYLKQISDKHKEISLNRNADGVYEENEGN